jgi:hypothetical protein
LGNPARYSMCIAENPDTKWQGLNEWEGFDRSTSTVTVASGYQLCMCRTTGSEPDSILAPLVDAINHHEFCPGCIVVTLPPPLEELFVAQGWTKKTIRDYLFEHCRRSVKSLKQTGRWGKRTNSPVIAGLKGLAPIEPGDESRFAYLFKRVDPELDSYVFHEAATGRRADILIVAAGADAGAAIGFHQPYAASTNPVTRPVKFPQQR